MSGFGSGVVKEDKNGAQAPAQQKVPNERGLLLKLGLALVLVLMALFRLSGAFQPDPAQAAYNNGVNAFERKDYTAARQAFTTAAQKDEGLVAAWMNLALTELELNHPADAEKAARHSIELLDSKRAKGVPGGNAAATMKAQAYAHLSLALTRQERFQEALDAIRQALRTDPRHPKASTWKVAETELQSRIQSSGVSDPAKKTPTPP